MTLENVQRENTHAWNPNRRISSPMPKLGLVGKPQSPRPAAAHAYRFAFITWFGLPPAEADMLVALYAAEGAFIHAVDLAQAARITVQSIYTRILGLRSALETEAVDCIRSQGYRLSEGGLAECRAALWIMGEELRRAS